MPNFKKAFVQKTALKMLVVLLHIEEDSIVRLSHGVNGGQDNYPELDLYSCTDAQINQCNSFKDFVG
jgi:hypothetical protein